MSVEYTWTVTGVDCLPQYKTTSDFVQIVYWLCSGSDGSNDGAFPGSTQLEPGKGPYTKYENLTEDKVLGWTFEAMGNFKDEVEAKVAAQIAEQAAPAVVSPALPWAVETAETAAETLI